MSNGSQQDEDLISIIVPIYNVEDYVEKCIDSIMMQSYRNLQIILVDDGSTDNSGMICDIKALQDSRIQVVHKKNEGLLFARKTGVLIATGKYVGFVDGDDYIDPDMYKELWICMKQTGVDMVHSGYIYEQKGERKYHYGFEEVEMDTGEQALDFLCNYVFANKEQHMTFSIWSKLFKTDLLRKCFQKIESNVNYGEDGILLCIYILESKKVFWKKIALYHYMLRANSLTNQSVIKKIQDESVLYAKLIELFKMYNCGDLMKNAVEHRCKRNIQNLLLKDYIESECEDAWLQKYIYPEIKDLWNKRIVLYGAGEVGNNYYSQIIKYEQCSVVAWVDSVPEKYSYKYRKIWSLNDIKNIEYDIIIIAVLNEKTANEIKNMLYRNGIDGTKVKWKVPRKLWDDM